MTMLHNYCRLCLDTESDRIQILENPSIQMQMKACLAINVTPSDKLPMHICIACVTLLRDFYNFQINVRCSQDWLESCLTEKAKPADKLVVHPLPESEYNSDSLLEFLNNTENIEEYLKNLGKEDIPSIVNILDSNNENIEDNKQIGGKNKSYSWNFNMEVDILDSDFEIVKDILIKEDTKECISKNLICFACQLNVDSLQSLSLHLSTCEKAIRTCSQCNQLFDSKSQMLQHRIQNHIALPLVCKCKMKIDTKEELFSHYKICYVDYTSYLGSLRCKECGYMFQDRLKFYKHAKEHIIKADQQICDICGHNFQGDEALARHKEEKHGQSDKALYRCKVCNFTSAKKTETYTHVQKHTRQMRAKHLCETCGCSFSTNASLMRHALQHKNSSIQCNICNEIFPGVKARSEHMLRHRVVLCEKCGQNVNSLEFDLHLCD